MMVKGGEFAVHPAMIHRLSSLPLRAGIGLRADHFTQIRQERPDIGFLEVHPENFFGGGAHVEMLQDYSALYPLSFHAVGLSLGSVETVDQTYLMALVQLVDRIAPKVISDHVSWSASGNAHLGDLLPLPYTEETLRIVADNISRVQDALGRCILVENPSTYLAFTHSTFSEPEFLAALCERTGCGVLLDVNNVYVQSHNNGTELTEYFRMLPTDRVGEIHLAGHSERQYKNGLLLIDTHDHPVRDEVWALYTQATRVFGAVPTLIEWDRDLPMLAVLMDEAAKAEAIMQPCITEFCHAVA